MDWNAEYRRLLTSLAQTAVTVDADGLAVEVRSCADRSPGELDPRTAFLTQLDRAAFQAHSAEYNPALRTNETHLFGLANTTGLSMLEQLRALFGWNSTDRSTGVTTQELQVNAPCGAIPVWKYEVPTAGGNRPCLVYFHGGGFLGGSITTEENQCRLLAQLAGAVVLSVDYPLSPENRYPVAFDACYAAVVWAHSHATELGISTAKIAVAGDSAGGNLALICSMRDRDEGRGMVAYQALIYPTLSRAESSDSPYYYWREAAYSNPGQNPHIAKAIRSIGEKNAQLNAWYMPSGADPFHPYLSPIAGSAAGLPKTLMLTAEYDFLRLECEEFSRLLLASGIPARHIRYGGIFHSTFERLGYAPQVEDMLLEIAKDLKAL